MLDKQSKSQTYSVYYCLCQGEVSNPHICKAEPAYIWQLILILKVGKKVLHSGSVCISLLLGCFSLQAFLKINNHECCGLENGIWSRNRLIWVCQGRYQCRLLVIKEIHNLYLESLKMCCKNKNL